MPEVITPVNVLIAVSIVYTFLFGFVLVTSCRLSRERLNLTKIIAELYKRHPDDKSFRTVNMKPGDPPELTRFRAKNAAGIVFEITADGSRITAGQVLSDT